MAVSIGRSLGSALGCEYDAGLTRYLSMPAQPTAGALFHAPLACCRRSRASQHLTASSSSPLPTAAAAGRLADGLLIRRIQANIDASGRCQSIVCTVQRGRQDFMGPIWAPSTLDLHLQVYWTPDWLLGLPGQAAGRPATNLLPMRSADMSCVRADMRTVIGVWRQTDKLLVGCLPSTSARVSGDEADGDDDDEDDASLAPLPPSSSPSAAGSHRQHTLVNCRKLARVYTYSHSYCSVKCWSYPQLYRMMILSFLLFLVGFIFN